MFFLSLLCFINCLLCFSYLQLCFCFVVVFPICGYVLWFIVVFFVLQLCFFSYCDFDWHFRATVQCCLLDSATEIQCKTQKREFLFKNLSVSHLLPANLKLRLKICCSIKDSFSEFFPFSGDVWMCISFLFGGMFVFADSGGVNYVYRKAVDLIMHRGLNVHLLYNNKYPLSFGYRAEEAEAICSSYPCDTARNQLPLKQLHTTATNVIYIVRQWCCMQNNFLGNCTKGLASETLFNSNLRIVMPWILWGHAKNFWKVGKVKQIFAFFRFPLHPWQASSCFCKSE